MLAMPFCSLYNKEKINSEVTEKDYPLRVVKGNEICAILKDKNFIDGRILDIVDQEEMEQAVKICQSIRLDEQSVKILLLVRPEPAAVRKRAVDTKSAGLADDFVFYDSSLTYLLAKLEAL